uniref:F-box and leucine rich repeat protein n=1 Tax=Fundulus heteroclitus TaxID=8078 RepID=A0A3Q2P7C1_FUNHE
MEDSDGEELPETPALPLEIIVYILSFLHASDRKEAALVCLSWFHASQDLRFQKDVAFSFPASSSSLALVRGLARKPRCSLKISQLDGFSVSRSLLLEVRRAVMARATELVILRFVSQVLLVLQVRAALSGLEELDLSDLRYLSDLTLNRLTGCTPRLRRLSLAGCHIAFEFDPYRGRPAGTAADSSALLSLRNLRRLLTEQSSSLKALDLSRTSITPESLRIVAQVQDLVLEELHLQGCKELTDYSVEVLVKHQPGLLKLDLSGCPELSSRTVRAVARGLRSLTHLSLSRDSKITEKGLVELLSVSSLVSLGLSGCLHSSGAELQEDLKASTAATAQLELLHLSGSTNLQDGVLVSLSQLLGGSLKELDLTLCLSLTDLSVCSISARLQRLEVLRLGWCKEVTDRGLLGTVQDSRPETGDGGPRFTRTFGNMGFFQPPRMPFEERPRPVSREELQRLERRHGASLSALRRLTELDLSACSKLSDASITQVVHFPDLQRLSLSMLPEISDASLASVGRRCRSLTSLQLSHCPGITDRGVAQALPYLRRLQHLSLSCCDNITDRTLQLLMQHCSRLKTLDVSMCKNVSVTAVDLLQAQLPFLENVHHKFIGVADLSLTD